MEIWIHFELDQSRGYRIYPQCFKNGMFFGRGITFYFLQRQQEGWRTCFLFYCNIFQWRKAWHIPDLFDNIPVSWHRQKSEGEQNKALFIHLIPIVYHNRDLFEHRRNHFLLHAKLLNWDWSHWLVLINTNAQLNQVNIKIHELQPSIIKLFEGSLSGCSHTKA